MWLARVTAVTPCGVILLALDELGTVVLRARRPHRPPVDLPRQRTPESGRVAQTG